MYYLDYFGSLQKVEYTAHGYGSYFCLSTLDNKCHNKLKETEGIEIAKLICDQLKLRFLINQPKFMFKIVTETGVKEVVYEPKFKEF